MLGGFGEAVGVGKQGGDGEVGSAVCVTGFFEQTDGFIPLFKLGGKSDSQ